MKTLIVVRHAKSSWDNPDLEDIQRPLNARGERDAPRMAKRLKERDFAVNGMITSPAVRTRETCRVFADILGFPIERVREVNELYHASDEAILKIVRQLDDQPVENELVMLFGHNPGITDFINNLLDEDIENVPTTGVIGCRLPVERWKDVTWGCGIREFFYRPKDETK